MILVTASLIAREDTLERLLELSLEHVARSRTEPGCLLHGVHRDVENPLRLVFLEKWEDRAALDAHFAVQGSKDFARQLAELVDGEPTLEIFSVSDPRA